MPIALEEARRNGGILLPAPPDHEPGLPGRIADILRARFKSAPARIVDQISEVSSPEGHRELLMEAAACETPASFQALLASWLERSGPSRARIRP